MADAAGRGRVLCGQDQPDEDATMSPNFAVAAVAELPIVLCGLPLSRSTYPLLTAA